MTSPDPVPISVVMPKITAEMARAVAERHGVCTRPIMRRVLDRETGNETRVAIPCGSTRACKCQACAWKARLLRIHQLTEGWHRDTEPVYAVDAAGASEVPDVDPVGVGGADSHGSDNSSAGRRIRSTRRLSDAPHLPRVPMEDHGRS